MKTSDKATQRQALTAAIRALAQLELALDTAQRSAAPAHEAQKVVKFVRQSASPAVTGRDYRLEFDKLRVAMQAYCHAVVHTVSEEQRVLIGKVFDRELSRRGFYPEKLAA